MGDLGNARGVYHLGKTPHDYFYLLIAAVRRINSVLDAESMATEIADSRLPTNEDKTEIPIRGIALFVGMEYKPRAPNLDLIGDKIT